MAADYRNLEPQQEMNQGEPTAQELESQVHKARAELEELRRKQQLIEREKQRLEDLSRRQEEVEQGKAEMADKLSRGLVVVQREFDDTQRHLEQLHATLDSFRFHLRTLEGINTKQWTTADLAKEISNAYTAVDAARAEYAKAQARIAPEISEEGAAELGEYSGDYTEVRDFTYWLKSGFAFTLPLQILGFIGLIIWFLQLMGA